MIFLSFWDLPDLSDVVICIRTASNHLTSDFLCNHIDPTEFECRVMVSASSRWQLLWPE
jgi:hypothetical protein